MPSAGCYFPHVAQGGGADGRSYQIHVDSPLPIPNFANPQEDRASWGDPALQASMAAALKRFTPARERTEPFVPLNLPDPFEHIRAGQLRNPPPKNPMPPVIPLKKPTK